jgi:phenol hydroxylase P5 protein
MAYRIQVEPGGAVVEAAEGQTILDACLKAGVWLPYACLHGRCATCKVQVVEGQVEQGEASDFALMAMEREEGKCLACCAKPATDLVIEADIEEEPDARHLPIREILGQVGAIVDLTPTIKGIRLDLEGDGLPFQAGQYIQLQIPGVDGPRAFSLANSPRQPTQLELQVRRVPGGPGSGYLHDQLRVGDRLRFSGPYGRFYVRRAQPGHLLFLAGGSGLSSPRSMILDLLESGETRPITLIHGVRCLAELYDESLFRDLAARHTNFSYLAAISDEPVATGDDWRRAGAVHEVARERFGGDFRQQKAYLCGPPPMIEACIRVLMQGRLFEKGIFTEHFYSAADQRGQRRSPLFKSI